MAAKNLNKSKLKMYTSTRKNTFTLVALQSFSLSGVISTEKIKLKIEKFTDVCMTGGIHYTPSHKNVCKFFQFLTYIFSADITPEMLKLCRVTKVKVFFLVLVCIFMNFRPHFGEFLSNQPP